MIREYSLSSITLLKGILYDHQKEAWSNLLQFEAEIKKYFDALALDVYIDKSEGYAYLVQKELEEEVQLPKLGEKRQLNFFTSLLCIVLRKYLLEQDAHGGNIRAIISGAEIVNRIKTFLPTATDEVRQQDRIVSTINKVVEIGFLRKLEDDGNNYEIHRIIKGYVNADVIESTLQRIKQYAAEKYLSE
ncbi:DUF4194 domain-containing protein [Flaviaesturariibacter amylovorans]|uniref:DUF4194 domain-containing protein n=1 Tax=Flaviaesturariibacter amylovorans TaxID=1084520 RepID=A0ABP8H5W0_9BACT